MHVSEVDGLEVEGGRDKHSSERVAELVVGMPYVGGTEMLSLGLSTQMMCHEVTFCCCYGVCRHGWMMYC